MCVCVCARVRSKVKEDIRDKEKGRVSVILSENSQLKLVKTHNRYRRLINPLPNGYKYEYCNLCTIHN